MNTANIPHLRCVFAPLLRGAPLLLALAVLLPRLPFLASGNGLDPDAYRVLAVAEGIAQTGEYAASRLPGYPLFEYMISVFPWRENAFLTNGLTALFSALAALFLALIMHRLHVRHAFILAFAFSLVPVILIKSTVTMDFMIALAFLLGAFLFAMGARAGMGGVFLGLAIATRLSSAAMLIPLSLLLHHPNRHDTRPQMRRFPISLALLWSVSLSIAGLFYLPVLARYGPGFLTFHDRMPYPSLHQLLHTAVVNVWGGFSILAWAILLIGAFLPTTARHARRALDEHSRVIVAAVLAILIHVIIFLGLPHDPAYLIPVVPFVFLLMALLYPPVLHLAAALAMALSALIGLSSDGFTSQGPVFRAHEARLMLARRIGDVIAAAERLPEGAVIVAGTHLPAIRHQLRLQPRGGGVRWAYLMESPDAIAREFRGGHPVYYLEEARAFEMEVYGFDPLTPGADLLSGSGSGAGGQ